MSDWGRFEDVRKFASAGRRTQMDWDELHAAALPLLDSGHWRKFQSPTGQTRIYRTFEEFVNRETKVKYATMMQVFRAEHLDTGPFEAALASDGEHVQKGPGRPDDKPCNTRITKGGAWNDARSVMLRLGRDGHTDLIDQIRTGQLSANAAAIKAGYRKPYIQIRADNPELAWRKLVDHYGHDAMLKAAAAAR